MRDFSRVPRNRMSGRDVEITDIETCVIEGNFEWNYVRVHTDAGVSGIGEAYRGGGVTGIMEYMKRVLVGENPLDVERLVRRMVQETSGHSGTTGKVVTAITGIEFALWDIAGKILDAPIYQLLGGKYRDEVRIYADCHAGESYAVEEGYQVAHESEAYDPAAYAEVAAQVVEEEGFTALKFDLDTPIDNEPDPMNGRISNAAVEQKRRTAEAIRDRIGYDVDLAFDIHWDYTIDSAKRVCDALEPYDLMWLEDPVPPENMEAQREITRYSRVPIATGENRFRVHEFKHLLYDFGVDIITPDTSTCGGLAVSKEIASRAEENYIVVSPHNVCGPIGTMANVHLGACIPNFDVLEFHARDVDWWDDLHTADGPLIQDGYIEVPEQPGLGIDLDESVAKEHLHDPGTMFG